MTDSAARAGEALEFGSEAWIEAAREIAEQLVAEAPDEKVDGRKFSICEVYTSVPPHLEPDSRGRRAGSEGGTQ